MIAVPGLFALDLIADRQMFFMLPSFSVFAELGSQHAWAIGLAAVAVLAALGHRSRSSRAQWAALFALGTAHWLIALCFLCAPVWNTGITTYPVLAFMAWCFAWDAYRAR